MATTTLQHTLQTTLNEPVMRELGSRSYRSKPPSSQHRDYKRQQAWHGNNIKNSTTIEESNCEVVI